jgi:apolipoprotein N-acyltransferase
VLLGLPAVEFPPEGGYVFRNTAVVAGSGEGRYVKRRLVPFGEYVPAGGIAARRHRVLRHAHVPRRTGCLAAAAARSRRAARHHGDLLRGGLPRSGPPQAGEADVLITISNDSWFGASIGPLQHLQMAQMRALENGRWMLRGTNNGVTAIIDHRGAVTSRLPQFDPGVLRGEYAAMSGITPFTRFGHAPWLVAIALALAGCAWGRRRWRSAGPGR